MSDDVKACQVVQDYCQMNKIKYDKKDLETIARSRGKTAILDVFGFSYSDEKGNKNKILAAVPKSEEFPYCEVMDKIVALVVEKSEQNFTSQEIDISFETLLEKLHVPAVHYSKNDKNS